MRGQGAGLTTRASCLIAGGITAILCGMALGDIDLTRAGVLALAIPVASLLVVARARVRITTQRTPEPSRASAGEPIKVHVSLRNASLLPTGPLMLEDRMPATLGGRARFVLDGLSGREERSVVYTIMHPPRGRLRIGPLRVRHTDAFGMIDVTRSFEASTEVIVNPIVDRLPAGSLPHTLDVGDHSGSHAIGARGADDASTREYRQGDDLRKVHWRSTARTGQLMVRHEERPWQGRTTLVLDSRVTAHAQTSNDASPDARLRSSFEWAVSAVASIGAHLIAGGREVELVAGATATHRRPFPSGPSLADYLADVSTTTQTDLSRLESLLAASARDSTLIAVMGEMDAHAIRALSHARSMESTTRGLAILLDCASWNPERNPGATALAAQKLRASGWTVTIAQRGETTAAVYQRLVVRTLAGGGAR